METRRGYCSHSRKSSSSPLFEIEMPKMLTIRRLVAGLFYLGGYTNGNQKWLENLKKKETEKLVQAAKELEAKADPSLPKKRLPKNGVVK